MKKLKTKYDWFHEITSKTEVTEVEVVQSCIYVLVSLEYSIQCFPPLPPPTTSLHILRHISPPHDFLSLLVYVSSEQPSSCMRAHPAHHTKISIQVGGSPACSAPQERQSQSIDRSKGRGTHLNTGTEPDGIFMYSESTMHVDDWTLLSFRVTVWDTGLSGPNKRPLTFTA